LRLYVYYVLVNHQTTGEKNAAYISSLAVLASYFSGTFYVSHLF